MTESYLFEDTPVPRLKLLVLGDASAGKSAFLQCAIDGTFIDAADEDGVEGRGELERSGRVPVSLKTKQYPLRNSHVILQLWEVAADADETTMKVRVRDDDSVASACASLAPRPTPPSAPISARIGVAASRRRCRARIAPWGRD